MGDTKRCGSAERDTRETSVKVELCLDGTGEREVDTGIGFLNHMLILLAEHGSFDLTCKATGDLHVDDHHTTEDIGLALGMAFSEALGDKKGIARFGAARLPMQESLVAVSIDLSGRPFLAYDVDFQSPKVGGFDVELVEEFFQAFTSTSHITMHIDSIRGWNAHHMAEAVFKAAARALRAAVARNPFTEDRVPSSKGVL